MPTPVFAPYAAIKNRFGAVNELGVFAMTEQGLRESQQPFRHLFKPWR